MCFPGSAEWKREEVPDHKFDFVDTRDYHTDAIGTRLQYLWLYVLLIKSFAVYLSDLFSAITMLTTKQWSNNIFAQCKAAKLDNCVVVDFSIGKWIFVGCIIFGYLLLMYEGWKAKKIIISRDISYTFTNVMAQNYYSFRSYDHFCFFQQIENSTKKKDDFAFFVFFTFKGWKRLVLADGPRQSINCLTLYSFWLVNSGDLNKIEGYWNDQPLVTKLLLLSILFTVIIFLGSLLILVVAAICYVPLLCYIQGNLKEYCCHKVDKRIAELLKRKNRQRIQRQAKLAQKEARGDFSHLKNSKGELVRNPVPQPTLPTLEIDEFSPAARPGPKSNYASSFATSTAKDDAYAYSEYPPDLNGAAPDYPPPMPLYDQHAYSGNQPPFNNQYDQKLAYPPPDQHHGEFANSSTHLARAIDPVDNYYGSDANGAGGHARGLSAGSQQAYGRALHAGSEQGLHGYDDQRRTSAYSHSSGGLAYDAPVEPTTPHRRTASGAWQARQYDEDVVLAQQAHDGHSYQQQWPGYGPDQNGREQHTSPGHGRQSSRGGHTDYGQSHAM